MRSSAAPNFLPRSGVQRFVNTVDDKLDEGEQARDTVNRAAPTLAQVSEPLTPQPRTRAAEAERDQALVARARHGDQHAFGALVERYGQPILSLCYASTLDAAGAEDLSQEIFVAAWRNLDRFRGESSFSTWLFALARNASIDRARRARRRPIVGLPDHHADLPVLDQDPGSAALEHVLAAARTLSLPLRQALLMRDLQGLSYEEIAALQNVPLGTVRSRIAAARAAVAEAVNR